MDEKIKTWPLRFSAKENKIVLQYDVKAKYRLISRNSRAWSFFTHIKRSIKKQTQKPRKFVSVR